ncbi:MAG: 4-hydroxythreonine-4-phosphate dehydrogenase PdxA [Parvularculaceae bacterium]|nr:4-hydroxythreonine-4-phosphate dehydrogenase PdxA [Parvularculaceae bacterium]
MMAQAAPTPLAVTMGEPAGIGGEVVLKAYNALRNGGSRPFFVLDDPARLATLARHFRVDFPCVTIEEPANATAAFSRGLPVLPISGTDLAPLLNVTPGKPSAATAPAVIASIKNAVNMSLRDAAAGVVTLPIQKSTLQEAGFAFPGHTEYLGSLTEAAPMPWDGPRGPVMMLAAGQFRAVPATIHTPLASVPSLLTTELLVELTQTVAASLRYDFGIDNPKIALSGLNPHAGEMGRMGKEELTIILPALKALREQGIQAAGPFPADTMFHEEARVQYDAAVAMYHDQALIPIKTVAFHEAVNVTIGLPVIRTSPDHGTALPIAGKGMARADSTIASILLASQMADARAARVA